LVFFQLRRKNTIHLSKPPSPAMTEALKKLREFRVCKRRQTTQDSMREQNMWAGSDNRVLKPGTGGQKWTRKEMAIVH
jgi:hypothetical protein